MLQESLTEKLRGLSLEQQQEWQDIRKEYELWLSLPLHIRHYYYIKARYYTMDSNKIALIVAFIVLIVGVASYFFGISPVFSLGLIVVGIILGVISAWEIERRR